MDAVEVLRAKYGGNAFVLKKMELYLANLPVYLAQAEKEYELKEQKKLMCKQQCTFFSDVFLNLNSLAFVPQSNVYVKCEDGVYSQISEDTVTHLILIQARNDASLAALKHKITSQILARIKQCNLLAITPDARSVKHAVRYLCPTIFKNKQSAKYFLTIVGDILLGNRGLHYFIDKSFKHILSVLFHDLGAIFNTRLRDQFKHKYYDHPYEKCRVLLGKYAGEDPAHKITPYTFGVVAAHFSRHYGGSDGFLNLCAEPAFSTNANLMRDHTPSTLVAMFLNEHTVKKAGSTLRYKDVYLLWRHFLRQQCLPFVVSQANFKDILNGQEQFDQSNDVLLERESKLKLSTLQFDYFWSEHMTYDAPQDYDVEEILDLYNSWCEHKHLQFTLEECRQWLAKNNQPVVNNKIRVLCSLWNKCLDIEHVITQYNLSQSTVQGLFEAYVDKCRKYSKKMVSFDFFLSECNKFYLL
jgi:hypothetical protein